MPLPLAEKRRFVEVATSCPVKCKHVTERVDSLADYFGVLAGQIGASGIFWFRGHSEASWHLTPAALRPGKVDDRKAGLGLISDFKRIAEAKLSRPPDPSDEFKWAQIAQHYGLPTRLLDWTESAATALYFACLRPDADGLVFVMNPRELNSVGELGEARILDPQSDRNLILKFLRSEPKEEKAGKYPMAVHPVWGSERIIVQRGTFTLHGPMFSLDGVQEGSRKKHVSSLVAIPIWRESKRLLRSELRRIGVDEMTLFPELEHSCRHLKMCCGLMEFD